MAFTVRPTVEVWFDLTEINDEFWTIEDPVKGELDQDVYGLAGDIAVDITDAVYAVRTVRGRERELDEIIPGEAEIRLRNYDGDFLPDDLYTDGTNPYGAGNIVPGKRCRITVFGIPVFDGKIQDWSFRFDPDGYVDCSFTVGDALTTLARMFYDDWTATGSQTAGDRLADALDQNEVDYGPNRDFDDGVSSLQGDNISWGSNVLNYLQLVAKSDLGRLFASRSGVLTFRDRLSIVDSDVIASFADDGTGIPFVGIEIAQSSDLYYTRVTVDREGGTQQTVDLSNELNAEIRTLPIGGLLLDSDVQSLAMAQYLSSVYSTPQVAIKALRVALDGITAEQAAAVVACELGKAVEVTWTPPGMSTPAMTQYVIEGVAHEVEADSIWFTTLQLSPLRQESVFTIEDDVLGQLDTGGVLAF